MKNYRNKRWFNLDDSSLHTQLKQSPQIIGYVIEYNDAKISKYYDPFFEASRANYKWQFAMPTYKNKSIDSEIIKTGIMPSLISWKSEKPIYKMKRNQFEIISLEIGLSETQSHFNTFFKSFGEIEYVKVSSTSLEKPSPFKLKLRDNLRNIDISL